MSYAKGFSVRTLENGIRLVDVADPQTDADRMPVSYHFAWVPKTHPSVMEGSGQRETNELVPDGYTIVQVPVERTLLMTMLQLSNFTA